MAKEQEEDGAQVLEGRDLRSAAKQLSKGPMKFAFGIKGAKEPVLVMHKSMSGRALSNELKNQGVSKATYGTATAEDKTLVLAVEGAKIPSMQRMVTTLLRKEKIGKLTESRVADKDGVAIDDDADGANGVAAGADGAESGDATALLDELRGLQSQIQSRESAVGAAVQRLGAGGDPAPVSDYVALCVDFGQRARGCGDPELVEFAKTSLGRAKKLSGLLERAGSAPGAAAPGAPGKASGAPGGGVPDGAGLEGGYGDNSAGVKKTADGLEVSFKHEQSLPLFAKNFMVWVIPCYTKGGLKASLEVAGTIGKTKGVKVQAKGAGTMELGIGGTTDAVTAGPYGSIELSASNSMTVQYSEGAKESPDGWNIEPFTFSINGSGKVGIKVEVEKGPKLDASQEVVNWELFVVHVGKYSGGKFQSIDVRAGKDLNRLIAALEQAGPRIEQAVEKYAPQFVKDAAVDAAEWVAESDTAKKIADVPDKILKDVKEKTGVDVGGGVEELVQSLVDENGETSAEATRRVNEEMATFSATQDDLHAVMDASGLNGELKRFRTSAEYNAIIDVWQAEGELLVKGKSAPGQWRTMVEALVGQARQRQAQAKAQAAAEKKAGQAVADAALQAKIAAAVAAMEAARPGAQGQGNVLNNRLQKTPNPGAKKYFDQGWKDWAAAEAARQQVASVSGEAKIQKANEATAAYGRAKATFTTGIQNL